jgi:hypothetical protein
MCERRELKTEHGARSEPYSAVIVGVKSCEIVQAANDNPAKPGPLDAQLDSAANPLAAAVPSAAGAGRIESENVRERAIQGAATPVLSPSAPTNSDDAVRLAAKLAIDAGEYDRARALIDLLEVGRQTKCGPARDGVDSGST